MNKDTKLEDFSYRADNQNPLVLNPIHKSQTNSKSPVIIDLEEEPKSELGKIWNIEPKLEDFSYKSEGDNSSITDLLHKHSFKKKDKSKEEDITKIREKHAKEKNDAVYVSFINVNVSLFVTIQFQ